MLPGNSNPCLTLSQVVTLSETRNLPERTSRYISQVRRSDYWNPNYFEPKNRSCPLDSKQLVSSRWINTLISIFSVNVCYFFCFCFVKTWLRKGGISLYIYIHKYMKIQRIRRAELFFILSTLWFVLTVIFNFPGPVWVTIMAVSPWAWQQDPVSELSLVSDMSAGTLSDMDYTYKWWNIYVYIYIMLPYTSESHRLALMWSWLNV